MARFSQNGVFYSFEIMQGLLSNKNIRIPILKKSGTPPGPSKKPILGGQKPKWEVSPRRVCATVLKFCKGSKVTKILGFQLKKKFGEPPSPLQKLILGGQKPKWAVSFRRVCAAVLKFCRGS